MLYFKVLNYLIILFGAMIDMFLSSCYCKNRLRVCTPQKINRFWKIKTEMLSIFNGFESWGENKHCFFLIFNIENII